jgi:uncharacterized membrane protein (DUF4010 family)
MHAIEWTTQLRFAIALALGFLVGLERESTKEHQKLVFGGVRTHPIISMFGFGCAWLHQAGSTLMIPAGLLALGTLTAVAYVAKIRGERFGSTSEISALLTFIMGALALLVDVWVAMALGVVNTMLLSEKARLEMFVERLDKSEFLAMLKFLLVTVIILPVLPDQEYTIFNLNPATVWKIVILVSTLGFVGYVFSKKLGERVGLWLSGLLGGIVSSTAVTIAAGRIAQKDPLRSRAALQASLLAGSIMYMRVLVLVSIVSPAVVPAAWWKFTVLAVLGVLLAVSVKQPAGPRSSTEAPELQNPFEITPALVFAGLFVLFSIVTTIVKKWAGETGLLVLAGVVGVTDIDPFILSMLQGSGQAMPLVLAAIIVAMMSNTIVKGIYFSVLVPELRKDVLVRYGTWCVLHIPLIMLA